MRIALISDIHGNAVALRAVLDHIAGQRVDRVLFLGDLATLGPNPLEVIELLRELDCSCVLGNHDDFLLQPGLIESYTSVPVILDCVEWCRQRLSSSDVEFLATFEPSIELEVSDSLTLLLFHGSPRSHMENLLAFTPQDELDQMLDGESAAVMAGGHTHIQMLRQHRGMLIINPGSVGQPFKEYVGGQAPTLLHHAEYAILDASDDAIGVELLRVPLDLDAMRASLNAVPDMPLSAEMLLQYR